MQHVNRRRVIQVLGATLAVAPVLAACGAAPASNTNPSVNPTQSTDSSPTSAVLPGSTLAAMGLTHGPATVTLPADLAAVRVIDQPNVVTVLVRAHDATRVHGHLEQTLPQAGFTIDASSADSLLFHDDVWNGAWTSSEELAGVTFRRRS